MNPLRQICQEQAALVWQDQPSLGLLETINEVRVNLRGHPQVQARDIPGVETLRHWFEEAIASGALAGPRESGRRRKK